MSAYRLPRLVVPSRYSITLEPDLAAFTFSGSVKIDVDIREQTDQIVINAAELVLTAVELTDSDGVSRTGETEYQEDLQRAVLKFDDQLATGSASLSIRFTGVLNDQLHGFYRSTFDDLNGDTQVIATSQFEATDARRAFPSWDEPDLKAVFNVTLVVPENLLAVTNTKEVSRTKVDGDKVSINFADSIKMSTYLLAFIVGPLEATEPVDVDGVPLRVVAPYGKLHLADYALEAGAFCLRYFADYYGIPYPGDKMDMIAIPDFAFGAMENLGAVTFRENALLIDPDHATQAELQRIVDVVAHELAHMWFGDLVTMKWWNGIWLNEAFATFMEMKATDAFKPEWKRWFDFGASERPWAFGVDSLASTRPVEFEVQSPEDANQMFDALTYGKGSSILRMIEQYLGAEAFRQGVGDYLNAHQFANTETADLWAGLNEASRQPVGEIMDTWIFQGGYPQISVSPTANGVRLSQRRYLVIPDETDQTTWKIPVQLRGNVGGEPVEHRVLLDEQDLDVDLGGTPSWLVANGGGHGFYRSDFTDELRRSLMAVLETLDGLERFTLADDTWAFVEAGQGSVHGFLDLVKAYRTERELAIWHTLVGGLADISHHLVTEEARPAFQAYVSEVTEDTFARLGWEPAPTDDDLTRRLRGMILTVRGRMARLPDVVEKARRTVDQFLDDPGAVDPDVAQSSLFVTAANGNGEDYERFFNLYSKEQNPQDQFRFLQAVAGFDTPDLVERTIEATLDGSVRTQDGPWVVARQMGHRKTGAQAWSIVRRRWSEITSVFPPLTIPRVVEGISGLSQPEVAADVAAFFSETEVPTATKAIAQNLERLRANTALRQRETARVSRYLGLE